MVDIYKAEKGDALAVQSCCEKAFESYISLIGKKPAPMNYSYQISNSGNLSIYIHIFCNILN